MPALNIFNSATLEHFKGSHNWTTNTFKLLLTNSAPSATNTTVSNITQITAGNGYPSGGITLTISAVNENSGTARVFINNVLITASGGTMATWRYGVIANTTNNLLIGWFDNGSSVSLTDGNSHSVAFDQTNGALTLSRP